MERGSGPSAGAERQCASDGGGRRCGAGSRRRSLLDEGGDREVLRRIEHRRHSCRTARARGRSGRSGPALGRHRADVPARAGSDRPRRRCCRRKPRCRSDAGLPHLPSKWGLGAGRPAGPHLRRRGRCRGDHRDPAAAGQHVPRRRDRWAARLHRPDAGRARRRRRDRGRRRDGRADDQEPQARDQHSREARSAPREAAHRPQPIRQQSRPEHHRGREVHRCGHRRRDPVQSGRPAVDQPGHPPRGAEASVTRHGVPARPDALVLPEVAQRSRGPRRLRR
jgi:hypothetical protein